MTADSFTIQELHLDVGDGHSLYIQDWGNRESASPIVFLHGGPGSSAQDKHKSGFDPSKQRVIFFDQRGCGLSTPYGSIEHNTTADLVEDIDKIADKLEISKFIIAGGSWGSCLALCYAVAHPEKVSAMLLDGILTGNQSELSWIDQGQTRTFFPDVWQTYVDATPKQFQDNPSRYHFEAALGDDPEAAKASAYAYQNMEGALLKLNDQFAPSDYQDFDLLGARLEMYYLKNSCFLEDDYIFSNAHKLTMPIWLVQGRYDMVCPPITAYRLHQKLPNSQLIWTLSGHKGERETTTLTKNLLLQNTNPA